MRRTSARLHPGVIGHFAPTAAGSTVVGCCLPQIHPTGLTGGQTHLSGAQIRGSARDLSDSHEVLKERAVHDQTELRRLSCDEALDGGAVLGAHGQIEEVTIE